MRRNFDYYLILVSLTLVSGGGNYLKYIRDDYCELYLNASEIGEKSCHKNGTFVITNEYELTINSFTEILVWNWTKENIIEWNAVPITIRMEKLWWLKVFGNWSPEDYRLQPASFYLKKLNVTFANKFQINTKHFAITEKHTHYKKGPLNLRIEFKGSDYLEPINYVNASTNRIQEFGISEVHAPDSDLCDYFTFFSLPELQDNVIKLHFLNVNMTVNMKCFKNYSKLMFIYLKGPYQSYENLTAIICQEWNKCHFTIGLNGLRCPADCECSYLYYFKVNCSAKNKLTQIPPLPIPSDNKINLFFSQNQLSQLPNKTLPGYMAVVSLHVSGNQITSIAIDQLPRNLTHLDISDNPIKTIDSEVADFLTKINYVMQTDIRWMANCDEEHLFKFFQKIPAGQDIYFDRLNGTCPKKCMCCFNGTTNTFLINCTSKGVTYPEIPTHIPNKVAMLLANCGITKLPSNMFLLLKTQNVAHLDLRNNRLNSLDDMTVVSLYEKSNTTIELSGNPLDCHCKTKSFLGFLKDRKPSEYTAVLDRCNISMCPDNCVCCLDNLNSSGLNVDCRGRRLTEFPLLPSSVTRLDLGNNDITEINLQWQEFLKNKISSNKLKIFLAGNPWICTCDNDIVAYTKSISQHIQDFAEMECSNLGKRLALVEDSEICPSYFIYPLILFVFSLIIITALNAFVYFKQPILMWFYEHEICMSMAVRVDLERMKKFDAFLCFTHKDEHLIEDYVEKLEKGQRQFRLCFYLRDWNVGASIPECIIQSVKDSRRIIILMTKNFLESTWGKLEFRLALHATSKDRCKRLIVILYPDVENFDELDSELKAYMVLNTYLRRDSPNFWNKLIYSMPHVS